MLEDAERCDRGDQGTGEIGLPEPVVEGNLLVARKRPDAADNGDQADRRVKHAKCGQPHHVPPPKSSVSYRPGVSPRRLASNRNQTRLSASSIHTSSRLAVATSPCP